jgi:hypothetical protein
MNESPDEEIDAELKEYALEEITIMTKAVREALKQNVENN